MANTNLGNAKTAKNDEFYTQYADIQKEINAYLEYNPDVKEAWDDEFGDRVNQLVIIGKGYNKDVITAALKSCLDEKAIA